MALKMACWCCINRKRTAYSKLPQSSKQGASEKKSSSLPLFCCQIITTTRRILMKMRTPVTAFQMTSLHWQRSVSVNRTMTEKLKLNQLVYIGAEGHCLCCFKYQQHSIIHLLSFKTIKNAFWKSLQSSHFRALTWQAQCISENTCFQGSMSGFISQDLVTDVDFLSVFCNALFSRIWSTSKWKHWQLWYHLFSLPDLVNFSLRGPIYSNESSRETFIILTLPGTSYNDNCDDN